MRRRGFQHHILNNVYFFECLPWIICKRVSVSDGHPEKMLRCSKSRAQNMFLANTIDSGHQRSFGGGENVLKLDCG